MAIVSCGRIEKKDQDSIRPNLIVVDQCIEDLVTCGQINVCIPDLIELFQYIMALCENCIWLDISNMGTHISTV